MLGRPLAFDFDCTPPEPEWLVTSLIERGTVNLLAADSGAGKSFLCAHLAACMVRGEPWLGRATRGTRILVLDNENHPRLVEQRLRTLGVTNKHRDNLRYFCRLGVQLGAGQWLERTLGEVEDFKPDLIVLDTVSSTTTAETNTNDQIAHLYATVLRPLAGRDRAVIIQHHEKKPQGDGNQKRDSRWAVLGGVQWRAQADSMFSLERKGEVRIKGSRRGEHERIYPARLTMPKSRDGEVLDIPLVFRSQHDGNHVKRTWVEERQEARGA